MSTASDTLLKAFITQLEKDYHEEYDPQVRLDVAAYLSRRLSVDRQTLSAAMAAIKAQHALRFGPPDVATCRKAFELYEESEGTSLRPRPVPSGVKLDIPSVQEIIEASAALKDRATKAGINTKTEGWLMQLILHDLNKTEKLGTWGGSL
ncbi:MAG: hypothetical protein WAX33_04390 [Rectinemataceae bacterium]